LSYRPAQAAAELVELERRLPADDVVEEVRGVERVVALNVC
jgi:hypothetical protein